MEDLLGHEVEMGLVEDRIAIHFAAVFDMDQQAAQPPRRQDARTAKT